MADYKDSHFSRKCCLFGWICYLIQQLREIVLMGVGYLISYDWIMIFVREPTKSAAAIFLLPISFILI